MTGGAACHRSIYGTRQNFGGGKKLPAVCSSSDGLSERSIFSTIVSVEVMESPFFKDLSAISLRTLPMFTHLPILQKVA